MQQIEDNSFLLTNEEVEQAMVTQKLSFSFVRSLLGLVISTQTLPNSLLFFENMMHASTNITDECERRGQQEGDYILQKLRPVLCEQWEYCRRRSTDGLDDPRYLVQVLAPLVGPVLQDIYNPPGGLLSRPVLIVTCVFVARTGLSNLCHCGTLKNT